MSRPLTELDAMAQRIADVLNDVAPNLPILPSGVDLRMVAELCWALDVTPVIDMRAMPNSQDGHTESRDREGGV